MIQEQQDSGVTDEAQVGRIVHYVIDNGEKIKCLPAIVVEENSGQPGNVNLQVFTSGNLWWKSRVWPNNAVRVLETWHWPRSCKHLREGYGS